MRSSSIAVAVAVVGVALAACGEGPFDADPTPPRFQQVTTGEAHTCARDENGVVWCWGRGVEGQLGTGSRTSSARPTPVQTDLRFVDVSAGARHTCAVALDGGAWCWGWNAFYQRGNAFDTTSAAPVPVDNADDFVDVDAGAYHTCGVTAAGTLHCWGYNRDGQLGNGRTETSVQAERVGTSSDWVSVSAGASHSCAIEAGGATWCWGSNSFGQLGANASLGPVLTPVPVEGGVDFVQVSAGATHTCASTASRAAYCWGTNASGELGDGALWGEGLPAAIHPQLVPWDSAVVSIDAGDHVTCAIPSNGVVHCWGYGLHGQLGVGTTITHARPQAVFIQPTTALRGDLVRFTDISATGAQHTCGVTNEGAVYCWGESLEGALGNRYSNVSPVPQQVAFPEES